MACNLKLYRYTNIVTEYFKNTVSMQCTKHVYEIIFLWKLFIPTFKDMALMSLNVGIS
jgi:hypothetical protein